MEPLHCGLNRSRNLGVAMVTPRSLVKVMCASQVNDIFQGSTPAVSECGLSRGFAQSKVRTNNTGVFPLEIPLYFTTLKIRTKLHLDIYWTDVWKFEEPRPYIVRTFLHCLQVSVCVCVCVCV